METESGAELEWLRSAAITKDTDVAGEGSVTRGVVSSGGIDVRIYPKKVGQSGGELWGKLAELLSSDRSTQLEFQRQSMLPLTQAPDRMQSNQSASPSTCGICPV